MPGLLDSLVPLAETLSTSAARERCERCAAPIGLEHHHVVDLATRRLLCSCSGCHLLLTAEEDHPRFRPVPDRYLSFPGLQLDEADWDALQIPVGLACVVHDSVRDRMIAVYPGPAGATVSQLTLDSWTWITAANPLLKTLQPDVEALLFNREGRGRNARSCHLVPIEACYQLVGTMRQNWLGIDGGQPAREAMRAFFADVRNRSLRADVHLG
jgi:hypothetical protein